MRPYWLIVSGTLAALLCVLLLVTQPVATAQPPDADPTPLLRGTPIIATPVYTSEPVATGVAPTRTLVVPTRAPVSPPDPTPTRSTDVPTATPAVSATARATTPTATAITNMSPDRAQPLGWGVPITGTLTCPVAWGCGAAGFHVYFLADVKHSVPLVALTYNLAPGVDTFLALYRPLAGHRDPDTGMEGWQLAAANDDAVFGRSLRSQLTLTPDWDGTAMLIVRPGASVSGTASVDGRYTLLVGPPDLPAIRMELDAQARADGITATPTATTHVERLPSPMVPPSGAVSAPVAPAPAAPPAAGAGPAGTPAPAPQAGEDAEQIIKEEDCTIGFATVLNDGAKFYGAAPPTERRLLATYPKDSRIILLGHCYLGWVKVQPSDSVTPGWMYGPDLRLVEAMVPTAGARATARALLVGGGSTGAPAGTPAATPVSTSPVSASGQAPASGNSTASRLPVRVQPALQPSPTPAAQPQTLHVEVQVVDSEQQPQSGMRVVLANAFGDVLLDTMTPASGQVTLPTRLHPGTRVFVQIPALGLTVPVDVQQPQLTITLPGTAQKGGPR